MSAYIVGKVSVTDPETYKKYIAKTPALIKKHGGRFLVRGGDVQTLEGENFNERMVIVEFPSQEALHNFYNDPDYQAAMVFRHAASTSEILAVQGV